MDAPGVTAAQMTYVKVVFQRLTQGQDCLFSSTTWRRKDRSTDPMPAPRSFIERLQEAFSFEN